MAYPFLEEIAINPPYFSQNLHRTGKQTLGGYKQNLVCTRIQEKGVLTPQETNPDLPVSIQESLVEAWVGGGLLQGWEAEFSSVCMGPVEGGHRYLHYLHHSLASGQTGRVQSHPLTENWIKDLLSMTPPMKTRPSFPFS